MIFYTVKTNPSFLNVSFCDPSHHKILVPKGPHVKASFESYIHFYSFS